MTQSDFILQDPEALLRDSAWLARLARALCSDRDLADDLSQDVMLAALTSRTKVRGEMRSWLSGILRRKIADGQRLRTRRYRHETATEPQGTAPATDDVVARAAMLQGVVTSVMELAEPYRSAVLLRYFEGLSCREIAARLTVPVETVRTRIKRGVSQLRERMEREHGDIKAWLAPVFGMGRITTNAAVGISTFSSVVVLMMTLKIGVPLVLAAVLLWCFSGAFETGLAGDVQTSTVTPESLLAEGSVKSDGTSEIPTPTTAGGATNEARIKLTEAPTVLEGKIIGAQDRQPLAGVSILLFATDDVTTQDGELNETLLDEELPAGFTPIAEAQSDDAGHYRLTLEVSQPFYLRASKPGFGTRVSTPLSVRSESKIDLGAAELSHVVLVSGRVTDTNGHPGADLKLGLWSPSESFQQQESASFWQRRRANPMTATTDETGRFHGLGPIPVGRYALRFDEQEVRIAQRGEGVRDITKNASFLEILIDRQIGLIRGVVREAGGGPLAGVSVNSEDGFCYATSAADGRFELQRRRGSLERVRLQVWRARFSCSEMVLTSERSFSWGQDDVELEVDSGVTLNLRVVQAPAMTPLKYYAIDIQREGGKSWHPNGISRGGGPRSKPRKNGVATIPSLVPGRYRVLVSESDQSTEVVVDVSGAQEITRRIVIPEARRITFDLVDAQGKPVVGSQCDLYRPPTEPKPYTMIPLQPDLTSWRKGAPSSSGGTRQLTFPSEFSRIAGGRSNARGSVSLRVPPRGQLALHVFGPGHMPIWRTVDLRPSSGRVRIDVLAGGSIRGQLKNFVADGRMNSAAITLRSLADRRQFFPARFARSRRSGCGVDKDGRFELKHVPPGDWQVYLFYVINDGQAGLYQIQPLGEVQALQLGEIRKIRFDAQAAAPIVISGFAMIHGKPAPFAKLSFSDRRNDEQNGTSLCDSDAKGQFRSLIAPGTYKVTARILDPKTREVTVCLYSGEVIVIAETPQRLTLDFEPAAK